MTAGTRRDPSAESRELERLRKMASSQSVRLELRVERGAVHARLDSCGARNFVDLENFVQMHQIDRHRAAITIIVGWLDASDHARAAAIRHRGQMRAAAPVEDSNQIVFIAGERDDVDWIWIMATKCAPDIAGALAVGMPVPVMGAGQANRLE